MKLTALHREILDLAVEDYYGLWEIEDVVARGLPEPEIARAREVSRSLMLELADGGLIEFYLGTRFAGEERPLAVDEMPDFLVVDRYWDAAGPTSEPHVRIGATKKGEEQLQVENPSEGI